MGSWANSRLGGTTALGSGVPALLGGPPALGGGAPALRGGTTALGEALSELGRPCEAVTSTSLLPWRVNPWPPSCLPQALRALGRPGPVWFITVLPRLRAVLATSWNILGLFHSLRVWWKATG